MHVYVFILSLLLHWWLAIWNNMPSHTDYFPWTNFVRSNLIPLKIGSRVMCQVSVENISSRLIAPCLDWQDMISNV
jgi:hypothetical protein